VPPDTPIAGTENGRNSSRANPRRKDDLDVALAREDVVNAGKELVARHPEVGAIVLECTNMPPYAAALQAEVGLPVRYLFDDYVVPWRPAATRL
jgi:hypothetical protein